MKSIFCSCATVVRNSGFAVLLVVGMLVGCGSVGIATKPASDNPSPAAGTSASKRVNEVADKAAYKPVQYLNVAKTGPQVVVIPGAVKSSNGTFVKRYQPNSIAEFAELELTRANFKVLERSNLKSIEREFELAYTLGDPKAAQSILQHGRLKATRWVMSFDILKADPVATAKTSFNGATFGKFIQAFAGKDSEAGQVGDATASSLQTEDSAGVWLVGMRYRIIDANTTEQVATGYKEQKMEVGATSSAFVGVRQETAGGTTLDTLVQQLVQLAVADIDSNYK